MSFVADPMVVGVGTVAAIATLAVLGIHERRRGGASWRLAALGVAVLALLALAVRPVSTRVANVEYILSTAGATAELERGVAIAAGREVVRLDYDDGQRGARGARVHLVGNGLHRFELDGLAADVVSLAAPALDDGLRAVAWSRSVRVGDRVVVRGLASLAGGGRARLVGPGGEEEAIDLASGESAFELGAVARAAGPELRRLELRDATGEAIDDVAVDVAVVEPAGLAVLWLESAPSFETRHCKRWLLTTAATLVVRSVVSGDRVRIEAHPAGTPVVDPSWPGALERFDLVVSDEPTLAKLPAAERAAIAAAVTNGLGLVLRPGTSSVAVPIDLAAGIEVRAIDGTGELEVTPRWAGITYPARLTIPARELVARDRLRPIVRDEGDRLLAAWHDRGAGRIARTVLDGTYRWVLEGNPGTHAEYWREVLASVARRRPRGTTLTVPAGPIYLDRPLTIEVLTIDPEPELTVVRPGDAAGPRVLALGQSPVDAHRWQATLYPSIAGWHRLVAAPSTSETWFFASPPPPASRDAAERQAATRAHLALVGPPARDTEVEAVIAREVPRWWAFIVFVLALASLWLDERLGRGAHGP